MPRSAKAPGRRSPTARRWSPATAAARAIVAVSRQRRHALVGSADVRRLRGNAQAHGRPRGLQSGPLAERRRRRPSQQGSRVAPIRVLDGFGAFGAPPAAARPVAADDHGRASADHPPGFYGPPEDPIAVNTLAAKACAGGWQAAAGSSTSRPSIATGDTLGTTSGKPMWKARVRCWKLPGRKASSASFTRVPIAALGVHEDGSPATEDTPSTLADRIGPYQRSKFLAEEVARNFARQGLPVVIVNPSSPVGIGDHKPTPTGQDHRGLPEGAHFRLRGYRPEHHRCRSTWRQVTCSPPSGGR